jgi:porin
MLPQKHLPFFVLLLGVWPAFFPVKVLGAAVPHPDDSTAEIAEAASELTRISPQREQRKSLLWFPDWIESEFGRAGEAGVTPFFNYWGVFQANPVGGLNQGAAYSHEILFGATFDLEKLAGWPGAKFRLSGGEGTGRNLSTTIGNVFNTSQAFVITTAVFYEMFLEQSLFDGALTLKAGRVAAADDFCNLPAFGLQVTGGLDGTPTSFFLNSNFTSSPNATWGAVVSVKPGHDTYINYGIYQADDRIGQIPYHGLDFSIRPGDGVLMLAEIGWEPTFALSSAPAKGPGKSSPTDASWPGLPGTYSFGGYYSNFPLTSATNPSVSERHTFGFYLLGQQTVWQSRNHPDRNFALWSGVTYSPQLQVAQMPFMAFGGTVWQGPIPGREQDQLLCTWMTGILGPAFAPDPAQANQKSTAETVLDFSYVYQISSNIFFQPDLQVIIRPNGTNTPTALVLGAQIGCNF